MYGMGISLGGLENAVDILFNTDEHEDNDTTLSIKTKNIRKSVKYTGRTTKSTTNKEAIIEKYSLETVCKTISSTELNNYNDLIADTIDFDFNTSEDNSDTEEKKDNSNSLNENTNGFEVEEGYDEYNDLDTDYLGEEENDDAEDDSCFGEEENDDADFAEDGDCFGEEDDSCFGEEDEYNEEGDEYNEEGDNSNYLDIMKEDKNILSEEDMLSEEEYNEEEEYAGEEDESDYLDDMDEDDSCFGDEEDDSCFGDEDEDNNSFENEEDILDEEEGILDEEEDILDEEEDTQYVETISHNQESYNSYESTTQQKSSVMQYSKSSTPIGVEKGSNSATTESSNTRFNSSDSGQVEEKPKTVDTAKDKSPIDSQDNACKQAFNLRKVVNNDISKKSGNNKQTTDANKLHPTDVYDSMNESKLFTLVKKFMKLKGLERSTIDLALLNKQFGEANVKRLIRKNFLIKIGKGVTTGR
jgi:hypothetical protein